MRINISFLYSVISMPINIYYMIILVFVFKHKRFIYNTKLTGIVATKYYIYIYISFKMSMLFDTDILHLILGNYMNLKILLTKRIYARKGQISGSFQQLNKFRHWRRSFIVTSTNDLQKEWHP